MLARYIYRSLRPEVGNLCGLPVALPGQACVVRPPATVFGHCKPSTFSAKHVGSSERREIISFLSTSGSCQRCAFSWEGHIFCHEVYFRMYLPLALEVYNLLSQNTHLAYSSHLNLQFCGKLKAAVTILTLFSQTGVPYILPSHATRVS